MDIKKIYFKNILSYGNTMTEIDLSNVNSGVVVFGPNGSGKSTLVEALHFALFGKPYRNVNIIEIVNKINCCNLVCGVEFINGKFLYKLERGISPDYVKLERNGEEIEEEVSKTEMQKKINKIIGVDYKIFSQIALVDSLFYKPFMSLGASDRRFVIDSIFGLTLISDMSKKVKGYESSCQESITKKMNAIEIMKEKIIINEQNQERRRMEIFNEKTAERGIIEERKKKNEEETSKLRTYIDINKDIVKNTAESLKSIQTNLNLKTKSLSKIEVSIERYDEDLVDIEKGVCDKCKQPYTNKKERIETIEESKKNSILEKESLEKEIKEQQTKLDGISKKIKEAESMNIRHSAKLISLNIQIKEDIDKIFEIDASLRNLERDVNAGVKHDSIGILQSQEATLVKELTELRSVASFFKTSQKVLTDDGIRFYILKNYLPYFNGLIKKYLELMNCPIRFVFDNDFTQVVDDTYKNTFDYESLSAGQKKRVNLALLFAFIEFAQTKSSTKFDFIFCDEIIDSSLDAEGKEIILDIFKKNIQKKLIIITHDHLIQDLFDKKIQVKRHGNFSEIHWK